MKKIISLLCLGMTMSCYAQKFPFESIYLTKLFDDYSPVEVEYERIEKNNSSHYVRLLQDELRQPFFGQLLFTHGFSTDDAFDTGSNKVRLANQLFGCNCIYLSDIYLPARLAKEIKFIPPSGSDVNHDFNEDLLDQFLPQLADVELHFGAQEGSTQFDLSFAYRYDLADYNWDKVDFLMGFNIPVIHVKHELDLQLLRGGLSDAAFNDMGDSIEYFFKEFNSVQDFVTGFVLRDCKNICYDCHQSKLGFGDVSFFLAADFGRYINLDSQAVSGLNISAPTAKKACGKKLWEIELGNGGGWVINPFFYLNYHYSDLLNPDFFLGGFFSPTFDAMRRVPECIKTQSNILASDSGLCLPGILSCFTIKPFADLDSCVPAFADKVSSVSIDRGAGMQLRIGNNFYALFGSTLELGVFYRFALRGGDCLSVKSRNSCCNSSTSDTLRTGTFNTKKGPESCSSQAHIIEWRLSQRSSDYIGWSIGSSHVIAGKNIPRIHQVFAKLALFF